MAAPIEYEVLRDLYEITEMRDGCVYKTKRLHPVWVDWDGSAAIAPKGFIYASLSTSDTTPQPWMRKKKG